jgi:hypothetical protein
MKTYQQNIAAEMQSLADSLLGGRYGQGNDLDFDAIIDDMDERIELVRMWKDIAAGRGEGGK